MNNTIIYLVGNPGVGKQAIAEALAKTENITQIDNHLYTAPIFALSEDFSNPKHKEYRLKMRDVVYQAMLDLCPKEQSFVFTNVVYKNNGDLRECPLEQIARKRGALFVPVHLKCNLAENKRRIRNPFRKKYHKTTNPDVLDNIEIPKIVHENLKELDVTNLSVNMAVKEIIKHIKSLQKERFSTPQIEIAYAR